MKSILRLFYKCSVIL